MKFLFLLFFAPLAFASGTITLEGKMQGKTANAFTLLVKGHIYTVKRSALSEEQKTYLEKLRWNNPVMAAVPFTAISEVKAASLK